MNLDDMNDNSTRDQRRLRRELSRFLNRSRRNERRARQFERDREKINSKIEHYSSTIADLTKKQLDLNGQYLEAMERGDKARAKTLRDELLTLRENIRINKSSQKITEDLLKELEDTKSSLDDNFSSLGDQFSKGFESIGDALNTLHLGNIADSITSVGDSFNKTAMDIANKYGVDNKGLMKELRKAISDGNKKYGNKLDFEDTASMSEALANAEVDQKLNLEVTPDAEMFKMITSANEDSIAQLVKKAGTLEDAKKAFNKIASMEGQFSLNDESMDSITQAMTNFASTKSNIQARGLDYDKLQSQLVGALGGLEATGVDTSKFNEMFKDIFNQEIDNGKFNEMYGGKSTELRQRLLSGDSNALDQYIKDMTNGNARYLEQAYGDVIDANDLNKIKQNKDKYMDNLNKAMDLAYNPTGLEDLAKNYNESLWDRMSNFVNSIPIIGSISNAIGSMDLSVTDVFAGFTMIKGIFEFVGGKGEGGVISKISNMLKGSGEGGVLKNLASKNGILGRLFAKGSGIFAKGGFFSTLISKGGNLLKGGGRLLGRGGVSLLSKAGDLLGPLLSGGGSLLASLGGGSAILGGAGVLGGLGGLFGVGSALGNFKDAIFNKDNRGENVAKGTTKLGMVGTGAAAGAAIGSAVPVVGTLLGGLIGVGVGGVGAIFSGDKVGEWIHGISEDIVEGVKTVGTGISDFLGGIFDNTFGSALDKGFNFFKDLFGGFKEKSSSLFDSFNFFGNKRDQRPVNSHKTGLDRVPYDNYKANLHKNEAVLTAEDNKLWQKYQDDFRRVDKNALQTSWLHEGLTDADLLTQAQASASEYAKKYLATQSAVVDNNTSGLNLPSGGDFLGAYTVKYETGSEGLAGGGMVSTGANDPLGGISYGLPQYSTRQGSAKEFVNWLMQKDPSYKKYFQGKTPGTSAFGSAWKQAFNERGEEFARLQLKKTYDDAYIPWVKGSRDKYGVNFDKNRGFQEAAYSMSVQHGAGGYKKYVAGLSSSMSDDAFLKGLYQNRINKANVPTVSRWKRECDDMLGIVNQPSVQYKQGTPFVPSDQVALLHKGEMVVPKEHNPHANPGKFESSKNESSKDASIGDLIKAVKDGIEFIARKMDNEKPANTVVIEKSRPRSLKGAFYESI